MIEVLLAEDNVIVRNSIARFLEKQLGITVIYGADNGLHAVKLLENSIKPDLIITDLNMPEMNGFELTEWVRTNMPGLPVIILTMHNETLFRERAIAAGARDYLMKNGDMEELAAAIRNITGTGDKKAG